MPEYLSPGVYVEEIDAGPKPIAGVSTSTNGMVGVTAKGPTDGKPRLVTSFAEFTRVFGGFLTEPSKSVADKWSLDPVEGARWWLFPLSVKGFFDNGGQRVFVKRVFAANAVAASARRGKGLVSHVTADTPAGERRLTLDHLFGIDNGTTVKLFNGEDGTQIGPDFSVTAYDAKVNRITLDAALPAGKPAVETRGDFVEIRARSASPVPNNEVALEFKALSRGAWGNDVNVDTRPAVENTLALMHDPGTGGAAAKANVTATATVAGATTVTVDAVAGFADGDRVQILGKTYGISNLNAANKTFVIGPSLPVGQTFPAGTPVKRLRGANAAGATTVNVFGARQLYKGAIVELDNGRDKDVFTVDDVAGDAVTLSGGLANTYHEGDFLRVIGVAVRVSYPPAGTLEEFGPLRLVDDGTTSFVVTHINARSDLVRVNTGAGFSDTDLSKFPTGTSGAATQMSGGDDKLDELSVDDFVGEDKGSGARTGIQALEDIDEVSICSVPNVWSSTVRSALITHCELLLDRFAIIDPQDDLSNEEIRSVRAPIDTKYAALYYPWIVVRDPLARKNVPVAPSGHVAGIYARTDVERGVHKAPANVVVRGIDRLHQDVTKREQDLLNPKGINVLRSFPNLGNRVWGARTLTSDQSWKYVNVRRLFIFVEESIDEGTQWVVFEPNDEPLWARVRQSVANFLTTVWRNGALEGTTPEEAFFVQCDRTTMTQTDIDNGLLICLVGIAPVKPAEFVVFRIQQKTREQVAA